MLTNPAYVLRLEGAALLALAIAAYIALPTVLALPAHQASTHAPGWWTFAALFFLPDLSMLGYLGGARRGALLYNLAHTTALPILLLLAGAVVVAPVAIASALIWLAHIGFDRTAGYGLKHPTAFNDTHLGRIGQPSPPTSTNNAPSIFQG